MLSMLKIRPIQLNILVGCIILLQSSIGELPEVADEETMLPRKS